MYNPKSLKAEEFISDEEIRETLAYADANKENVELIDQILAKAKECKGLTHREASVLLACPIPEKIQDMYDLAVCTVRIIRKISILPAKNLLRKKL